MECENCQIDCINKLSMDQYNEKNKKYEFCYENQRMNIKKTFSNNSSEVSEMIREYLTLGKICMSPICQFSVG